MTEDTFMLRSGSPDPEFAGRPSVSFQDFGRESLGILPSDFGKDSLGFLNTTSTLNRPSLSIGNILHISEFGRESLEGGRESLGILNRSVLDINFGDVLNTAFVYPSPGRAIPPFLENKEKTPKIKLTTIEESINTMFNEGVDTAFLFPSPRRPILSSVSSQNSGAPSFNSCSLEGPSKIYSISRSEYTFPSYNNLDMSLGNSDLDKAKFIGTAEIEEQRPRIKSMPNAEADVGNLDTQDYKKFWSTGKPNPMRSSRSLVGEILDFDDNKEDNFYNSIFIEGNYIARKIADGSIFDDSNVLDSTNQPSWPSDLEDSGTNEKKTVDTETVFKTIDKLLPECLHISDGMKKPQNLENSSNDLKDVKGILQNLSEILNNTHRSDQEKSQGQNLLSSLAEMLQGSSSESKQQNFDDSGHSSFTEQNESPTQEKYECCEVLDSSKRSLENSDKIKSFNNILDSSSKAYVKQGLDRRLSQSFCAKKTKVPKPDTKIRNSSISGLELIKNESGNSNLSAKSNDSHGSGTNLLPSKFKSKPSSSMANRGPLKAIIPVKDMKRKSLNNAVTPEKSQQPSGLALKSKRTSTPINEPKLKPMAASTPSFQATENKQAKGVSKRKSLPSHPATEVSSQRQQKLQDSPSIRNSLPSPLTKNVAAEKTRKLVELPRYQKVSTSSSMNLSKGKISYKLEEAPKLDKKPVRRNSVSECINGGTPKLKRSNSLGKETGIMSSLSKVRENLRKSAYFQGERKALLENNHIGTRLKKMGSDPSIITTKTLPKSKISNKENAK